MYDLPVDFFLPEIGFPVILLIIECHRFALSAHRQSAMAVHVFRVENPLKRVQ